jgi:hypothetical protein
MLAKVPHMVEWTVIGGGKSPGPKKPKVKKPAVAASGKVVDVGGGEVAEKEMKPEAPPEKTAAAVVDGVESETPLSVEGAGEAPMAEVSVKDDKTSGKAGKSSTKKKAAPPAKESPKAAPKEKKKDAE